MCGCGQFVTCAGPGPTELRPCAERGGWSPVPVEEISCESGVGRW